VGNPRLWPAVIDSVGHGSDRRHRCRTG
jgi:hypothetical protein